MNNNVKNIYTLDFRFPFLEMIAKYIITTAKNPNNLSNDTIFLPTKRACRKLSEIFLKITNEKAIILPKLIAFGEVDEDENIIYEDNNDTEEKEAINNIEKTFILAKYIYHKMQVQDGRSANIKAAIDLAEELFKLINQINNEMLSFDKLKYIVPDDYAFHWQENLKFLNIISEYYPLVLEEKNLIDSSKKNVLQLLKQAEILKQGQNENKRVFACGSTGSMPATANLLNTVASLKNGMVILPSLDMYLDDESFEKIIKNNIETHSDFNMARLLNLMNVKRSDVKDFAKLIQFENKDIASTERTKLKSEILRPAETSDIWRDIKGFSKDAIKGIKLIETKTDLEEAKVIAFIMREALEQNKTSLLITSDRNLSKMVSSELKRWNIEIDDSAGIPLRNTQACSFVILCMEALFSNFAPYQMLAMLKHPLCSLCDYNLIEVIEKFALCGIRHGNGIDGMLKKLENIEDANNINKINEAKDFLNQIINFIQTSNVDTTQKFLFDDYLTYAFSFAEFLSNEKIWTQEESKELYELFCDLKKYAKEDFDIFLDASDAFLIFVNFASKITVRKSEIKNPKIAILGAIEARLLTSDVVIVSGLNEGTFPKETETGPWMGRHMMKEFGLPSPERKIGLSAHDFGEFFCAKSVILTRAEKTLGVLSIPSRFVLRLKAVIELLGLKESFEEENKSDYLYFIKEIDKASTFKTSERPMPKPPLFARPKELWVTEIERLMRDPYDIYAKKILKLKALDEIDKEIDAAYLGNIIHNALQKYIDNLYHYNGNFDDLKKLLELIELPLNLSAFYNPKIQKIASWFIERERKYKQNIANAFTEIKGELKITDDFVVKAKADRIDILKDESLAITDYKTGKIPNNKEMFKGYSPQLPLEALIAMHDGFKLKNKNNKVSKMSFIQLGSGDAKKTGGNETLFEDNLDEFIQKAHIGLKALVMKFANENTSYIARPHPKYAPVYSDYEHLSRIKEWQNESDDE